MDDEAFRHGVWARLEPVLAGTTGIEEYLRAVLLQTGDLIGVDGSFSFSTVLHGHLFTAATTDREAWEADQVEYDTEAGPCVEALQRGLTTDVPDLALERRWPAWSAISSLLGFGSAGGVPADITGGERLALNLYAVPSGAFSGAPLRRAALMVEEVARTLPTVLRISDQDRRAVDLQEALASRSTIDQALGVLMAQNRCSRDEAFAVLRRASQHRNLKLREVARAVIERFTGHEAADPPPFRAPATARPGAAGQHQS